jgi:hypothetical protein
MNNQDLSESDCHLIRRSWVGLSGMLTIRPILVR